MAVLINSSNVCQILGIKPNNLYQIQYRGQIKWVEKRGRNAYYDLAEIEAYKMKRDNRSS